MSTSLTYAGTHSTYATMVTQLYTFSSWTKSKSFKNGSSSLPYVGFPGLTLTPIPENPLLDSMHQDDCLEPSDHEKWLKDDAATANASWNPRTMKKGSLPNHWITSPTELASQDVEAAKDSATSSKICSMDASSKQSFLPKDVDPSAAERRRSHLMKLLLFALCGVVIIAGILLWIFSPAFA